MWYPFQILCNHGIGMYEHNPKPVRIRGPSGSYLKVIITEYRFNIIENILNDRPTSTGRLWLCRIIEVEDVFVLNCPWDLYVRHCSSVLVYVRELIVFGVQSVRSFLEITSDEYWEVTEVGS